MMVTTVPLWASILIALLAGGASGATIQVVKEIFSERKKNKIRWLEEQQQKLYGPLYFYFSQNQVLLEIMNRLDKAYNSQFVNKNWSDNPDTQDKLEKEALKTLEVKNEYFKLALASNEKVTCILKENISLLDTDDLEIVNEFLTDYMRLKVELDDNSKIKLPAKIYFELGGQIQSISQQFLKRIEDKYLSKKQDLMKMRNIN